ncbi:phosphomannomutase [Novimethylophilus kurashikiensis]|uniref:Phosphomannomutase n=1 Tax=Novimethylophilus kurashikiensis TaxID=1825523 RepID=A0A2R5FDG4_9PROT|nr:hypothetical protein [Novimethylophilus kurashikiensis]GBG14614.1 phosphomannomutase [Novimethylophilus kurashikiensis]
MRKNAKSRHQAGFIQNFIIPGIILIGVVIAGIAMLSSGSGTNTDNEKASMMANAVIAQGLTVTSAVQRAEADGAITGAQSAAGLSSVLVGAKYIASGSMPSLPSDLGGGNAWVFDNTTKAQGSTGTDIGSALPDNIITIPLGAHTVGSAQEATCLRINAKLYSTSTVSGTAASVGSLTTGGTVKPPVSAASTAAATGTEGCVDDGTNYTFYKVVDVK